jgi:hypothetical protein
MLLRKLFLLVTAGDWSLHSIHAFPFTVEQFAADSDSCKHSDSCRDSTADPSTLSQHSPPQFAALLQKQFKLNNSGASINEINEHRLTSPAAKMDNTGKKNLQRGRQGSKRPQSGKDQQ